MPTTDPQDNSPETSPGAPAAQTGAAETLRLVLLILLLVMIAAAFLWLFGTAHGRTYLDREQLKQVGHQFRLWVGQHPITATLGFIALYIILALLALPLWWLQIVGGCGFGLVPGVLWSQCGSVIGAALTVALSDVLAGDLFAKKIESRRAHLAHLDKTLGHNGFLVVMAVRLCHVIPFGLSNYMFGLIHIRRREAALGTLLGNIPVVTLYTAIGAGMHPWKNWHFMAWLALLNVLLLVPLAVRYFKPEWFQRIGVE